MVAMNYAELFNALRLMAANRSLSRSEFERARLVRFRRFAAYVMQNSPYYQRVMRERDIDPDQCSPEQFPVLTKADLIEHFDDIVTVREVTRRRIEEFLQNSHDSGNLFLGRYHVIHTSGSSGQIGYFIYDPRAWAHGIAQVANVPPLGIMLRRRRVAFIGAVDGHYAGVSMAGGVRFLPFNLIYTGRFFDINAPIAKAVEGMNAFRPDVVIGYGTALGELAAKQLEGVLKIRPRNISNSGEPLTAATRELIERAFGPCLRNVYSCSEHLIMGVREAKAQAMRLCEDELMFEMSDDHTLVTNLYNRALPLIRYRMGDVLQPVESDEHSPYRSIAEVVGRVEQVARFVNGRGAIDGISPHAINELLIPHVRRFQMRITGPSSFELAIVLEKEAGELQRDAAIGAATARLKAILVQKEMENVAFSVCPVDALAIDPRTRKFKLILDVSSATATV